MSTPIEFAAIMERAKAQSIADDCTVHVFAQLAIVPDADGPNGAYGVPRVIGFGLSDWFDGATVASWTRGRRD